MSVTAAMLARDFARASRLLENATPAEKEGDMVPFFDGMVARAQHNAARARSSFQFLRDRVATKLRERPDDAELGLKENALREAKRAIELCPVSRDAVDGPFYETMLALVYAMTGEHDAALTQLEQIL